MQRGITRRRSPSLEGDNLHDRERPRQRQRYSSVDHLHRRREEEEGSQQGLPLSFVRSTPSDPHPAYNLHPVMANSMGHPLPSNNGSSTSNGAEPGPSTTNGHSMSHSSHPLRLEGKLMYEDDRDWAEHQHFADTLPDLDDVEMDDGVLNGEEGSRRRKVRPGAGAGKRMPVDREEVVRLILQGLRDIGYQ